MNFSDAEITELKAYCSGVSVCEEAGRTYFLLEGLVLPDGCSPATSDALLCPTERDGYPSRLFFAEKVQSPNERNWNANGVRIVERNWHAVSWNVSRTGLRLAEVVAAHLKALT